MYVVNILIQPFHSFLIYLFLFTTIFYAPHFNKYRVYALEMVWTFPLQTEKFHLAVPWYSEQFPLKITIEILGLVVAFLYMSTNVSQCLSQIHSFRQLQSLPFNEISLQNCNYIQPYFAFRSLSFSLEFIIWQSNLTPLYSNNEEISQVNLFANTDTRIHVSCRAVCKSHWNEWDKKGRKKKTTILPRKKAIIMILRMHSNILFIAASWRDLHQCVRWNNCGGSLYVASTR